MNKHDNSALYACRNYSPWQPAEAQYECPVCGLGMVLLDATVVEYGCGWASSILWEQRAYCPTCKREYVRSERSDSRVGIG